MLKIESLNDGVGKPSDWLSETTATPEESATKSQFIITQLTSGVRDQNRVNVFVNGKFALSLDIKQVIDLEIKVGRKITEDELQELHKASEFGKLYQRALEWVLSRPHSLRETRDYLKRKQLKRLQMNAQRSRQELKLLPEIQDVTIDLVITRLIERGHVDDVKFAGYYVENRFQKKGISTKRLQLELRKKGVDESIIRKVLEETARNDDDELTKMIIKKSKRYDKSKLIQYLVRQGFSYDKVVPAVEKVHSNDSEEF